MPKKKNNSRRRSPIDWLAVEATMLKSFRGQARTEAEQRVCDDAWKRSPKKYAQINDRMRLQEIGRIRQTGAI